MKTSKQIELEGIGLVIIDQKPGLRNTSITVRNDYVKVSTSLSFETALEIIEKKRNWILKSRAKLAQKIIPKTWFNAESRLTTFTFEVQFAEDETLKVPFAARLIDHKLTIYYKVCAQFEESNQQELIKKIIAHFLKIEANKYIPVRIMELANKHGFHFENVKISSAKSRWGSCNNRKTINISYNIMLLPSELIDFVLVHELCHTKEMNHGPRFEALMRSIYPNLDELEQKMKQYQPVF